MIIKIFLLNLFKNEKNGRKNYKFWQQKSQKKWLLQKQKKFKIDEIDVNKILKYNNTLIYFIGYNDNNVIRPLCLKLSKVTSYIRELKENITMALRVNDKQLF